MRGVFMQFNRTFIYSLSLLICLVIVPCHVYAEQPIHFSWAVLTDTPDGQRAVDTSVPIVLENDSTLQVHIEQQPGVYIYLYLLDSTGELLFLYPQKTNHYLLNPPKADIVKVPAGSSRLTLVPPNGREKLYVLASASRLASLEELTEKYQGNPEDLSFRAAVIQEIKKIRRRYSKLTKTVETSVPIAGTIAMRGTKDTAIQVTQVNAIDFYSKILRIDHE